MTVKAFLTLTFCCLIGLMHSQNIALGNSESVGNYDFEEVKLVEIGDFTGVCLSPSHEIPNYLIPKNQIRFMPDESDVVFVEEILQKHIKEIMRDFGFTLGPSIVRKNKKYFRQYVGFSNNDGDRLIFVNALWKPIMKKYPWNERFINILDGGSHFWKAKINLTTQKVEVFLVNGDFFINPAQRHRY